MVHSTGLKVATAALVLLLGLCSVAGVNLASDCPGNLIVNAGFEEPNTETNPSDLWEPNVNSKWGWYLQIPGM